MKSFQCDYCKDYYQVGVYIIDKKKMACFGCLENKSELKEFYDEFIKLGENELGK